MRPIVWDGWIINYHDALALLKGEIEWTKARRKRIRFLVDTGALRTIILRRLLDGIEPLYIKKVKAQGVCDKPVGFMLSHLGIALIVDDEHVVSIHGVLIPLDNEVEVKLEDVLSAHNADAILGLISLDELQVTIDEKTHKPKLMPLMIL